MANHLRTELVLAALNMALGQRQAQGVVHHSDRGSQYTSLAFGKRCREMGVVTSTGSAGDCFDNAMAESFFATLECELIDRRSFHTQAQARMAIFEYLESWYNTRRLHSALGYLSPNEFERRAAAACPMGTEDHREQTTLEPFRIGQAEIQNHPLGLPSEHRSPKKTCASTRLSFTPRRTVATADVFLSDQKTGQLHGLLQVSVCGLPAIEMDGAWVRGVAHLLVDRSELVAILELLRPPPAVCRAPRPRLSRRIQPEEGAGTGGERGRRVQEGNQCDAATP